MIMELRPSRCHRNKAPRRPSAIKNQIEGFPRWRMLWHRYDFAGGLALIAVTAFLGQMPMQRVSMILMSRRRSRALNSVRRTDLRDSLCLCPKPPSSFRAHLPQRRITVFQDVIIISDSLASGVSQSRRSRHSHGLLFRNRETKCGVTNIHITAAAMNTPAQAPE